MKRKTQLLILCKTYPSPSAKYSDTSCVAAMDDRGNLIRLYPVPFRFITEDRKFAKWQWIEAVIDKSPSDRRPESYRVGVDTISTGDILPTGDWKVRRQLLDKLPVFESFDALEAVRVNQHLTLGLIRPMKISKLDIRLAASEEWTLQEIEKLELMQRQPELFDDKQERASIKRLEKVPFNFYYNYECMVDGAVKSYTHKIVDWEVSQLYRNVRRRHGAEEWIAPFRQKLERELPERDLLFLMGTIHRFPGQWLIVSLIYPPKRQPEEDQQLFLF